MFGKNGRNLPNIGKFRGGPIPVFAKVWQKGGIFAKDWQTGCPGKNRGGGKGDQRAMPRWEARMKSA